MLSVPVDSDGLKAEGILCVVADVAKEDQFVLVRLQSDSAALLPLAAGVAIMPVRASFTPLDNVLVVYKRVDATDRKAPYDVFPGPSNDLRILRLVPGDCARSAEAARWRDVEDNWAVMLGNEFCNYEITAITLFSMRGAGAAVFARVELPEARCASPTASGLHVCNRQERGRKGSTSGAAAAGHGALQ